MMSDEKEGDLPPAQLKYQQWLRSKQVHVASNLVTTTNDTNLVIAGWGCVAKTDIEPGTVLFSIPRDACFGASVTENDDDDGEEEEDPTTRDTQMDLAMSILHCQKQQYLDNNNNNTKEANEKEDWSPFLNLLTPPPHGLPWTWEPEFRHAMLRGTELERVVENKIKRIRMEYEQIVKQQQQQQGLSITYQEYVNACAIVSSHTNPWFGVSIVPFNTTLNWGKVPNVEFDLEEEDDNPGNNNNRETCQRIVGRASCNIKKGQELFQAYGTSVADSVYRYGFAPPKLEDSDSMDGDVVSIDVTDILSIAQETKNKKGKTQCSLNSETLNVKTRRQVGSEESDNRFASTTNIPQLASRLDALKLSGALDESPWDGLDGHWTAEIARPAQSFLQSLRASSQAKNHPKRGRENGTSPTNTEDKVAYDDGGLSKLIGIFLVLLADESAWERASLALRNFDNDHQESRSSGGSGSEAEDDEHSDASDESRKDDITASILLSGIFHLSPEQTDALLQVALHAGAGGNDPWRALLDEIANVIAFDHSSEQKPKKRKTLQYQGEENEKDTPNTTACTPNDKNYFSRRVQLRAASEAALTALLMRREAAIEGDSSCREIITDLHENADREYNKNKHKGSEEINSAAKVEAFKTVKILRDVEKSILDQAIEMLQMPAVE